MPGRSNATPRRPRAASSVIIFRYRKHEAGTPCTHTTGWPLPSSRTKLCTPPASNSRPAARCRATTALLLTGGTLAVAGSRAIGCGRLCGRRRVRVRPRGRGHGPAPGSATEGERFELSVRQSGAQRFSRPPHSTALPPLQGDASRLPTGHYLREAKKPLKRAPHSSASRPPAPAGDGSSGARRGRQARSHTLPPSGHSPRRRRAAPAPGRSLPRTSRTAQA